MKTFPSNNLTKEEQLGLRLYNLEQTWKPVHVIKYIMMAIAGNDYPTFNDEMFLPDLGNSDGMLYVNVIQIIKYFGKELVTRMISFNYEEEMIIVKKAI